MAAVVKPLFIGQIAKSNKEKENEAVKKWVVEIEKESGRVETRLVPARHSIIMRSIYRAERESKRAA